MIFYKPNLVSLDPTEIKSYPFDGKFTVGELLGMSKYLPGIDAPNPN